jgi:Cu-Zn family superoxide dismutase
MQRKVLKVLIACLSLSIAHLAYASLYIPVYLTKPGNCKGKKIGVVRADDTIYGLLLSPNLHSLPPGVHGFHIHEMGMCGEDGMMAGGHLDPRKTDSHMGPYEGDGHLGDLPVLIVNSQGRARLPVLAPRLKLAYIKNKALMIHAGADNYSDDPKMGGGGARIACGVVPYHS